MNATSPKSSKLNFVHLNVHSENSLGDGMCKISDLIAKAKEDGMPAIALTDHGNLFGIKEFIDKVTNQNRPLAEGKPVFKPIIGMDAYCAQSSLYDKDIDLWGKDPIALVMQAAIGSRSWPKTLTDTTPSANSPLYPTRMFFSEALRE